MEDSYSRGIPIKFEGLDATGGTLEMYYFGNSLVGISRILKNSAHFAFRHEYAKRLDKPHVRILARPPREGTYILEAVAVAQTGYPLLQPMLEDVTWKLITTVVGAIFLRRSGRREEMNRLLGMVENLIEKQGISDKDATGRFGRDRPSFDRRKPDFRPPCSIPCWQDMCLAPSWRYRGQCASD